MWKSISRKEKGGRHHAAPPDTCPNCGCALTESHWHRCPRCQTEIEKGCGCGGCGNCGK